MDLGEYLRTNIKYWNGITLKARSASIWGEEEGKLSAYPRNVYLNSSPAQNVGRKPLELKSSETKVALLWAAEAVA
jgi:hypothetical protein